MQQGASKWPRSTGERVVKDRFMDDFRRFFLRGLGALVPTLLTFAILVWAYRLVNDNVGLHITESAPSPPQVLSTQ